MELHPLMVLPDLTRLEAEGNTRLLRQGPKTLAQALGSIWLMMDDADEAEAYRSDPVTWLRAHRPRRRLIDVLLHGRGR